MIVQFGGQTPLNISAELAKAGSENHRHLPETICFRIATDSGVMMDKLGIPMPKSEMASNLEDALKVAGEIGYPLMVRPSYVLGGRDGSGL